MNFLATILIFLATISKYNTYCLLQTKIIQGQLHKPILVEVNKSLEYIIDYNGDDTMQISNPLRIHVESEDSNTIAPVIVVVREKKEVLSWELPLIVDGGSNKQQYRDSARTLCYDGTGTHVNYTKVYDAAMHNKTTEYPIQAPYVSVSTMSDSNVTAKITLSTEHDFYLKPSVNYSVTISPSTPRYYYYGFPKVNQTQSYRNYDTVILEIFSSNSVCMTVSLQNFSCPVKDLNDDITFEGVWETISNKGGITISRDKFPNGFFLVFVAKGNDFECNGNSQMSNIDRIKEIQFIIKPSITYNEYISAVLVTGSCVLLFYVLFLLSLCMCNRRCYVPRTMEFIDGVEIPSPSSSQDHNSVTAEVQSLNDSEYDTLDDTESHNEIILTKPNITVSDLARKNQFSLVRKSYSYLWHLLTVALFYFLPVIQLVITYQKVLNQTGNQDLCYYNFLCAHPIGFFSDFNHIFSNIGYVALGLLFMWITKRREDWHKDSIFDRNYGVPHHFGLFYAIGFALVMEGILSGSYHVCPNHSNFQFDTSFMYITAVLCMIKIYHTRHPDINASAYSTFGILAVAILLGMIGIMESNLVFWIFFTVLHLVLCFYLTLKIYYLGCCKLDKGVIIRAYRIVAQNYRAGFRYIFLPVHKGRMVLLLFGNLLNWGLAGYGIYNQGDFAIYLLGLFMLNTTYYFTYYVIMKCIHKERINCLTLLFLAISLTCAVVSMYCFLHKSIAWSETPAQSRYYNQECIMMGFYDYHDIWHFLSAVGMFFMFMVLLTLDDDLSHKPRSEIPVF